MLKDRVSVVTATLGTGTVALGAAVMGYRSFISAYTANANVSYLIVEGSAWETGTGVFDRNANTMTRTLEASSTGALLMLAGMAAVSVVFLSRDAVSDWPVLAVGKNNVGLSLIRNNGFTTVPLTTVAPSVDTHGGWNQGSAQYQVKQTGLYQVVGKIRYADDSGNANAGPFDYGVGMDIANADSPDFNWQVFPYNLPGGTARHTGTNIRVMSLTAGDMVRLFTYADVVNQPVTVEAGSLNIIRIR